MTIRRRLARSNLVMILIPVAIAAVLLLLGARITITHYVDTAFCSALLNFLARTAYMSVGLGLFNLIPISPLDGSKVLFAFLPDRTYLTLMRYEKYGMVLRAKGIVDAEEGQWFHFDYTPGEIDIRRGSAGITGRLCVIGHELNEDAVAALFR